MVSVCAGAVFAVLLPLFSAGWLLRWLIAVCGFVYVIYLLSRSRERVGRLSVLTLWTLVAGAAGFFQPPLLLYVFIQVGMVWIIRSMYFYSSVLSALTDLGLNALALCVALWAWRYTDSFIISIWCFFLMQALFVYIPAEVNKPSQQLGPVSGADRFEQAYRSAVTALRKLSTSL
jgi:hypothetical protein